MLLGFADDGAAEIFIRLRDNEPRTGTCLCRKVLHVFLEFSVCELARGDLPPRGYQQAEKSYAEYDFTSLDKSPLHVAPAHVVG
jgi:hypothetical protein